MAVTTQAQGATSSPTKTEAETMPRRRESEAAGFAAVAFESLLDSTRNLVRAETHRATQASPAEMFEAPVKDGGDHRMASLEEQQRSDRTEARGKVENAPSDGASRRATFARAQSAHTPTAQASQPAVPGSPGKDAASVQLSIPLSDTRFAWPPRSQNGVGVENSTHLRTGREKPSLQKAVAPQQATAPGLTVTGARGVEAAVASAPNVAQQVGELLSATRGSVESSQGVSSTSAVGDGRSTATASKTTASEVRQTPQSQESARPSEGTATQEASPFARLVRSIQLQPGLRNSSARLQLHPPELGRLRVDVRLAGDQVEIEVRTETDAARDIIARRADELKTALEQHGIQVNRFDVTVRSFPEQPAGATAYDDSSVPRDAQRNPSWASGRQRSGEERTDDAGSSAAMRAASTTEAVAEARLDIRV